MAISILSVRRHKLGMTIRQLVQRSGVPVATVNRILGDPSKVRFEHVAAVAAVLGIDLITGRRTSTKEMLRKRAEEKARFVAKLVQGSQGLEAAAVDPVGYERLVEVSTAALLGGKKRKLWDDD